MNEWFMSAVVLPVAGWAWSVEKRLAQMTSLKEDITETKGDVKDIYQHLIGRESPRNVVK